MKELGAATSATERSFAVAWVGMAVIMSLTVGMTDVLNLPLQTVYVFAAGVTLREIIALVAWAVQK